MRKRNINKAKRHRIVSSRSLGFSLIEVVIAVGLLACVGAPISLNLINGRQLNSKAGTTNEANDMATSVIESIKSSDLSSIMTTVNNYDTDESGEDILSLVEDYLSQYSIVSVQEALTDGDSLVAVKRQLQVNEDGEEELADDDEMDSSVIVRKGEDDDADKTYVYFVGQDDDHYSFTLKDISDGEDEFDATVDITKRETFELANLQTSDNTTVFKETSSDVNTAINEFVLRNKVYASLKQLSEYVDSDYLEENLQKAYSLTITTENNKVKVSVNCTYTAPEEYTLDDGTTAKTMENTSFSHEIGAQYFSSEEIPSLVKLSFIPSTQDGFTIENIGKLPITVEINPLVDVDDPILNAEGSTSPSYTPSIALVESSGTTVSPFATTIYSTIHNNSWNPKSPSDLVIKASENSAEQNLYDITVKVYSHHNSAWDDDTFTPNAKWKLVETTGTFLDASTEYDVDDLSTTITIPTDSDAATVTVQNFTYDGSEKTGVTGNHVKLIGNKATNAGTYTATATPETGYKWSNGLSNSRTITWSITPAKTATAQVNNMSFNGEEQSCVVTSASSNVTWTGHLETEIGSYTAYATPTANYAWADGSKDAKAFSWSINKIPVTLEWGTSSWSWDGFSHTVTCTVKCSNASLLTKYPCEAILINSSIQNVGTQTAKVVGLTSSNYQLPSSNLEKEIEIYSDKVAAVSYSSIVTYNGTTGKYYVTFTGNEFTQTDIVSGQNVTIHFENGQNAGEYEFTATPTNGATWTDGTSGTKTFTWTIAPYEIPEADLVWGTDSWAYDGEEHSLTCSYKDIEIYLNESENSISGIGTKTVHVTGTSDSNYSVDTNITHDMSIVGATDATYMINGPFTYDTERDYDLVGVLGENVVITGPYSLQPETQDEDTKVWFCLDNDNTRQSICGTYTVTIAPESGHSWAAGTVDQNAKSIAGTSTAITVKWEINPVADAVVSVSNLPYTGYAMNGVSTYFSSVSGVGAKSQTDIGSYEVIAVPDEGHAWSDSVTDKNGNAPSTPTSSISLVWDIYEQEIDPISLDQTSFVYDGEAHLPEFQMGYYTISAADISAMGISITGYTAQTQPGTYEISLTKSTSSSTFMWGDGEPEGDARKFTWTITKRDITISFDDAEKTYDGTPLSLTYTVTCDYDGESAICSGDTLTLTSSTTSGYTAGTYSVTPSVKITNSSYGDITASCYNITANTTSVRINKRETEISANNVTRDYDGTAATIAASSFKSSNTASGDTFSITVASTASITNAGTYTLKESDVTPVFKHNSDTVTSSYTIKYSLPTITITAATPSLSLSKKSETTCSFGTPTFTITTSANKVYVSSSDTTVASASESGFTVTVSAHKAGTATITVTTSDANFTSTSATYVLTVLDGHQADNYTYNATQHWKVCKYCGATYNTSNHNLVDTVTTAATCTTDGVLTHACSICSYSSTETITKYGHSFTSQTINSTYLKSAATCTSPAVYYYKCSRCSQKGTTTFTYGSALGHSFTEKSATSTYLKTAATCTDSAVYYYKCSRCTASSNGNTNTTYTYGDALGHSYSTTYTYDGTNHWLACTRCSAKSETTAHTLTLLGSTATCTAAGKNYYKCTVCGAGVGLSDYTTSPLYSDAAATGHSFTVQSKTSAFLKSAANCTTAATYYYKCSKCGASSKGNGDTTYTVGDALGHSFSTTYSYNGTKHWYACTRTGCTATSGKENHSGNGMESIYTTCTCTDAGITYYKCTKCGAGEGLSDPTTSPIYRNKDALGHKFTTKTETSAFLKSKGADCKTGNTYYYACARCGVSSKGNGDTTYVSTTNFGDHSLSGWKTDSTNHWKVCSVCSEKFNSAAHTVKTWTTDTAATCTTAGSKSGTCTVCNKTATKSIAALGHSYSTTWSTDEDNHWYACTRSGCTSKSSKAAHSYGDWTITTAATCTSTGSKYRKCTTCSYKQTKTISKKDHSFTSKTTTSTYLKSSATCESAAVYYYKCANCTESSKGDTNTTYKSGDKADHSYTGKWKASTHTYNSTTYYAHFKKCTWCGATKNWATSSKTEGSYYAFCTGVRSYTNSPPVAMYVCGTCGRTCDYYGNEYEYSSGTWSKTGTKYKWYITPTS